MKKKRFFLNLQKKKRSEKKTPPAENQKKNVLAIKKTVFRAESGAGQDHFSLGKTPQNRSVFRFFGPLRGIFSVLRAPAALLGPGRCLRRSSAVLDGACGTHQLWEGGHKSEKRVRGSSAFAKHIMENNNLDSGRWNRLDGRKTPAGRPGWP